MKKQATLILVLCALACAPVMPAAAATDVSRAVMHITNTVVSPGFWASNTFHGAGTTGIIYSASGDAGKFLKADGTWATPAGGGGGSLPTDALGYLHNDGMGVLTWGAPPAGVTSLSIGDPAAVGTGDVVLRTASTNDTGAFAGWLIASTGITVIPTVNQYGSTNYTISATGGGGMTWPVDAGGGALTGLGGLAFGSVVLSSIPGQPAVFYTTGGAAYFDAGNGAGDPDAVFNVSSATVSLGGGAVGAVFTSANRANTANRPIYFRGSFSAVGLSVTGDDGSGTELRTGSLKVNGTVILSGLPGTDPAIAGALWNNAGVLTVSAGP